MLNSTNINKLFSNNLNLEKMKITINKTTYETFEVSLPTPKYVKFCNAIYYKFHEEGEYIVTTKFDFTDTEGALYPFGLQVSRSLNMESFEAADTTKYTIITGSEYYGKLQELLAKYSITHITPEIDAPTLFRNIDNSIVNSHKELQP